MSVAIDTKGSHPFRPALEVITAAPAVDVVIPVYNEERDLARNVRGLHDHLIKEFPFSARITIADNASTNGTWMVAIRLAHELSKTMYDLASSTG